MKLSILVAVFSMLIASVGCKKPAYSSVNLNANRPAETAQPSENAPAADSAPADRKSTRLNSSHRSLSRMPSSA